MCGGKYVRSRIKESRTYKRVEKNNARSWTFSESYS